MRADHFPETTKIVETSIERPGDPLGVWIVIKADARGPGWEIMGVFNSREMAKAALKPGETAAPFPINQRMPEEAFDFIEGEFSIDANGREIRRKAEKANG